MKFTWSVLKVIWRRHGRWKHPWTSGGSVRMFWSILWDTIPATTCTLVISGHIWQLFRASIIGGSGWGLRKIYLKGGQPLKLNWAVIPTPGTKWVGCVMICRSSRSALIWSHHQKIQIHVIYAALIDTQPATFKIGHQLTSFLKMGFRRVITDLLSIKVRFFCPNSRGYQAAWENKELPEGTNCIRKGQRILSF